MDEEKKATLDENEGMTATRGSDVGEVAAPAPAEGPAAESVEENAPSQRESEPTDSVGSEDDEAVGLSRFADSDDDSEQAADEIGVSGVYDVYKREIIPDVFENRLRQSPNAVKLAYGKLKNTLLSYEGVRRAFAGKSERFTFDGELVFRFLVEENALVVVYDGAQRISVRKEKGGESLKKALEIVEKTATEKGWKKKAVYVPTAYAERYPFNPEAVLKGHEDEAPEDGAYATADYDPIEGELTRDIVEEMMGEDFDPDEKQGRDKLEALRQQATTIKGAVALTEPIVYFYNVARDHENNVGYLTVQQVLNDKFLGKLLPQQFFAIAERSDRIVTLNLWSVQETVKACDDNPAFLFVTQVSARLLLIADAFRRLKKAAVTQNNNLVLAFDCALIEDAGAKAFDAIAELASSGVRIMLDNTESAGLKALTELPVDFLRFDARYYKQEDERKTAHLDMVLGYAKVQGINTSALYVDTVKEAKYLLAHGVRNIEGDVVGTPVRIVHNAVKEAKKLPIAGKA